jgi:hypothetical protein
VQVHDDGTRVAPTVYMDVASVRAHQHAPDAREQGVAVAGRARGRARAGVCRGRPRGPRGQLISTFHLAEVGR